MLAQLYIVSSKSACDRAFMAISKLMTSKDFLIIAYEQFLNTKVCCHFTGVHSFKSWNVVYLQYLLEETFHFSHKLDNILLIFVYWKYAFNKQLH